MEFNETVECSPRRPGRGATGARFVECCLSSALITYCVENKVLVTLEQGPDYNTEGFDGGGIHGGAGRR